LAISLIEDLRPRGQAEFLEAVAEPLPVVVFMRMMGMPLERLGEFRSWMHDITLNDNARRASAFTNIATAMHELISARQKERQNDLISQLLDADLRGR